MTAADKKICPLCAEEIKAAAKLCPHCRHWQNKWSIQNPHISVLLWSVLYLGFFCGIAVFLERAFSRGNDFSAQKTQLVVVTSEIQFLQSGTNRYLAVIGVITNQSQLSWGDVNVEARFFNADGKLVDVIPGRGTHIGVAISAHSEAAFKIESKTIESTNNFNSYKVFVTWAKDARSWP